MMASMRRLLVHGRTCRSDRICHGRQQNSYQNSTIRSQRSALLPHPILLRQSAFASLVSHRDRSCRDPNGWCPPYLRASLRSFIAASSSSTNQRPARPPLGKSNAGGRQQPPSNESLVAALVREAGAASSDGVKVRMVFNGDDGKASTEIVSLTRAIQKSVESDQDLIGIAFGKNQEVPVVRLGSVKELAYKHARKIAASKKAGQGGGGGTLPEKEFRFKTGIADNDLERKVANMMTFLEKGHNCLVNVRCTRREMAKDPDAALTMANRVLSLLNDAGEMESKLQINPTKTFARVLLRPKAK